MLTWILLLTVVTFSYCVRCGLVSDDTDQIANARIVKIKLKDWLVHSLDWVWFKLFKNSPVKWHLVVLGYHLITVSLFYLFCTMFFDKQIALVAGLLFAIHQCNNQGVMWISGRHYAILGWLTLICMMVWKLPILFIPLFATACLLHPQGTAIALILALFKPHWAVLGYILGVGIFVPYYWKTLKARLKAANWTKDDTDWKWGRVNMLIKVACYYFFMAIFPFWVGFYHSNLFGYKKELDNFNLKVILGALALIILAGLAVVYRSTLPAFSLGFFWFFIALIPCINIIHSNMLFSERYMYVPLLGFCLALSQILLLIPHWEIVVSIIITLYFVRSMSYSLAYRDNIKLFTANLKNQPYSVEAHVNIGDQYIKLGRSDLALPLLDKGVQLGPEIDIAWFNLGVAQYNMGFIAKAKASWEKSLEINPKYINPRFNLIRLQKKQEEMQKNGQWKELAEVGLV